MSDKTFGELFWGNVDKLLKENKKGLKDISRFLEVPVVYDPNIMK